MARQIISRSLTLVCLALTAPAGHAQEEEVFPKTPYPMGYVLDEDGKPIAGAGIRIRVDNPAGFGRILHQVLRTQPLVPVRSGRDGSYVLPLTEGQRHLAPRDARLSLVVEKEGYLPWVEHLPGGVFGYLGSRVILRRPAPQDRLAFAVDDPVPSMMLLVERVVLSGQPHSLGTSVALPVPADGRVETQLSLSPNPPQFSPSSRSLSIRLEARLLYPGRSTPPRLVRTAGEVQHLAANPPASDTLRTVRLAAGGTPSGLRGLYRCPDGRLRWFDLPGSMAPEDAALKLVALVADGHLATVRLQAPKLRSVPAAVGVRTIHVTDDGTPVPGARAKLLPLRLWTAAPGSPITSAIGSRSICRLRADDNGILTLPAELADEPSFLLVEAAGYRPRRIVEPRGLERTSELSMEKIRGRAVRIAAHLEDGRPLAGASLLFNDTAMATGALDDGIPRTDARGIFELESLPDGTHVVGVVADGYQPTFHSFAVREGAAEEVQIEVRRAMQWRLVCVDGKNRPVPFAPLEHIDSNGGTTRSRGVFATDSLGRAVINHSGRSLALRSARQGWRAEFNDRSRIHRVEVKPMPLVMVALEPGTGILQENWLLDGAVRSRFTTSGRGGSSRILTRWVGAQSTAGCWIVDRGPPIRLRGDEVMEAWAADPGQVVMIDRSKTTRRVPITLLGDVEPLQEDLRIIYRTSGSVVNLSLGPGQILEDGPDGLHLALRDDDELPCSLLHPAYMPLDFTVPERTDEETPLELRLEKGVGLVFEVKFDKRPRPDTVMTLRVRDRKTGRFVLNTIDRLPEIAAEELGNSVLIRSPAALPIGKFNVYFRIPGFPTLSADVNLQAGQPVVLRVDAPKRP